VVLRVSIISGFVLMRWFCRWQASKQLSCNSLAPISAQAYPPWSPSESAPSASLFAAPSPASALAPFPFTSIVPTAFTPFVFPFPRFHFFSSSAFFVSAAGCTIACTNGGYIPNGGYG
ncbi:hypothetical protein B0H14DRAFT_2803508, partial [Mycena olivaceomarginata]